MKSRPSSQPGEGPRQLSSSAQAVYDRIVRASRSSTKDNVQKMAASFLQYCNNIQNIGDKEEYLLRRVAGGMDVAERGNKAVNGVIQRSRSEVSRVDPTYLD